MALLAFALYLLERKFDSEAALDRALPDGAYSLNVSGGGIATSTPGIIPPPGNIRPPLITNFNALQSWTETPISINWQPIAGGAASDFVSFNIAREDRTEIFTSSGLTGAAALS